MNSLILFGLLIVTTFCNGHHQEGRAIVRVVRGSSRGVNGELIITSSGTGVSIRGKISGLVPGFHGFHIHDKGDLGNECRNAGGHFNPLNYHHGDPRDLKRHIGDLGNILADEKGVASINILDNQASLDPASHAYIGNRSIVVHADEDDLGRGDNAESLKTGNAGSRVGCGIIEIQQEQLIHEHQPLQFPETPYRNDISAIVEMMQGSNANLTGRLSITNAIGGLIIEGTITGLTPGWHGFHIHEKGDLGNSCKNAGGHFNPLNANHGDPTGKERHVGDLGNILADKYGLAKISIFDAQASLDPSSIAYIGDRAIVVHADPDDLGRGQNAESLKTGNAGARMGCGIIEIQDHQKRQDQPPTPSGDEMFSEQQFDADQYFATVKMFPGSALSLEGDLRITYTEGGILIQGHIIGLTPGAHGFHIHEKGDLGNECKNAKGHFNPYFTNHGDPMIEESHVGDLGNIEADQTGKAVINIFDARATISDPSSITYIGNRAIVVHAHPDDLGRGGNPESLKTGNAGPRMGCGIIEVHKFTPESEQLFDPKQEGSGGRLEQQTLAHEFERSVVKILPGTHSGIGGVLTVAATEGGIVIEGQITGLTPGLHGFHIHEKGDLGNACQNAGGHFNPFGKNHGDPTSEERHVGDLGNIEADEAGNVLIWIYDPKASLDSSSQAYIGNLSIVVHANPDDLGMGGNAGSLTTGNAGPRMGCGLIEKEQRGSHLQQGQDFIRRKRSPYYTGFQEEHSDPYQSSATGGNSKEAHVKIIPGTSKTVNGDLYIRQVHGGLIIKGTIYGLKPGLHGFHVHQEEGLGNMCQDAGPHFNPFNSNHGDVHDYHRHVGDLGNIKANSKGIAIIDIFDRKGSLEPHSQTFIGHRALVVHADPDDLGRGQNEDSKRTGNSGVRVGCGNISLKSASSQHRHNQDHGQHHHHGGGFQQHHHGGGNHQLHRGGGHQQQGHGNHEIPIYRPKEKAQLNLDFNFGPSSYRQYGRQGFGHGY